MSEFKYLFKISTKKTDTYSNKTPKPVYYVCPSKEAAMKWAERNLARGLSVNKITKLAIQRAPHIYCG